MHLEQYLSRFHLLHEPQYRKYQNIFDEFKKTITEKYDFECIEIYSTKVFPRRVKVNGKCYCIIDDHFFSLFSHYLMAYFLSTKQLPFYIGQHQLDIMVHNWIILGQASLQDDYPELALSFAQEYDHLGARFKKYDTLLGDDSKISKVDEMMIFSYMLMILHEMGHNRFHNEDLSVNGYDGLIKMLKELTNLHPDQNARPMIELAQKTLDSNNTVDLEEVYADYFAVLEIIKIIEKTLKGKCSAIELASLIMNVTTLPYMCEAVLEQNTIYWRSLYCQHIHREEEYKKLEAEKEKFFNRMNIRVSLLYYMNQIILSEKYKIAPGYVHVIKTDVFDRVSLALLNNHDYVQSILERAGSNDSEYSALEARKLRDHILGWH